MRQCLTVSLLWQAGAVKAHVRMLVSNLKANGANLAQFTPSQLAGLSARLNSRLGLSCAHT